MRLLVRSNAHRPVRDGVLEIAASPDTPRRERWQWQVRVLDGTTDADPAGAGVRRVQTDLQRSDGPSSLVDVRCDETTVTPSVEAIEITAPSTLQRQPQEVLVLLVGRGRVRVEDRHLLEELDVLVLEGDDPMSVTLEPASDSATSLAVARLQAAGSRAIGWVP